MKNNKKGFTLVELLAVIVILAVVILIAVTAVLPRMEKARKNSFVDEALAYIKAAQEANVASQMNGGAGTTCFSIENDLNGAYIEKKGDTYTGVVEKSGNNWVIYIKSSKYMIDGKTQPFTVDGSNPSVVAAGTLTKTTCS